MKYIYIYWQKPDALVEVATNTVTRVKGNVTRGRHMPVMWDEDADVPPQTECPWNFEVHVDLPPTLVAERRMRNRD